MCRAVVRVAVARAPGRVIPRRPRRRRWRVRVEPVGVSPRAVHTPFVSVFDPGDPELRAVSGTADASQLHHRGQPRRGSPDPGPRTGCHLQPAHDRQRRPGGVCDVRVCPQTDRRRACGLRRRPAVRVQSVHDGASLDPLQFDPGGAAADLRPADVPDVPRADVAPRGRRGAGRRMGVSRTRTTRFTAC